MPTPTRKVSDNDDDLEARKRPRLSDETEDVARGDSFSDGFFGSEIDLDDEALQMVDEYDVFQPESSADVTCVAYSGDGPFLDGELDEIPSSQGEADATGPYTVNRIHGDHASSSQCSLPAGSPARATSARPAVAVPPLEHDPEREDIDFGAYVPIPHAVGFASATEVLLDPSLPTFMPASQVPIDRSGLKQGDIRAKSSIKPGIKLAGGGVALKPISMDDIKASAEKLMNYQQDTSWKPPTRHRNMPPPATSARLPAGPTPLPRETGDKEPEIDFGALIKPPLSNADTSEDDAMPTFMPASQVPIDRSELPSRVLPKIDIKLAGGSGGLVPLTEEQIQASAAKLMAYQRDTTWKPQSRTRVAQASSSSVAALDRTEGSPASSDETEVNDSGIGLLEPADGSDVPGPKSKGKQREVEPIHTSVRSEPLAKGTLAPIESLEDPLLEKITQADSSSRPAEAPPTPSRGAENPFSAKTQLNGPLMRRSVTALKTPVRPSPTFRPSSDLPLGSVTRTSAFSQVASSSEAPTLSQTTPSSLYRLGLSQRKPKSGAPAFVTPFKPGMAPGQKGRELLDAKKRATPGRTTIGLNKATPATISTPSGDMESRPNGSRISSITGALRAEKERQLLERAVFDIRCVPGRKSLSKAGVAPASEEKKRAVTQELGIPYLSLKSASEFSFPQGGYSAMFAMLEERGCNLASKEWVKNHWGQIVWKLAALARTGAEEARGKWCWEEASRQMLYRYEREMNRAERPAVRLIQEHDASPARAMVLCVSDIQLLDNDEAEIELTDGWYRIRTVSDKALVRAARNGKLVTGCKIAVAGARLEGGNEGKEVLRAYHSSVLKIGGNSTSLARWDARLGFQPRPYIASLRSLTADGGPAALLDVEVTKIFPIGFVETDQKGKSSRPCDQRGEDEAQRAWEERRTNEATKWRIQFEKQLDHMKSAIDKLEYIAKGANVDPSGSPSDEAETFLEEFEDAEFEPSLLKTRLFSLSDAAWLAGAIQNKYEDSYERREENMERELNSACPPRKVRNFRVVVIKDARTLQKPTGRTAQLTVWDVLFFGNDTLRVGQRYLLANVQPSQLGSWRPGNDDADVYLSTRRDTKWTLVSDT